MRKKLFMAAVIVVMAAAVSCGSKDNSGTSTTPTVKTETGNSSTEPTSTEPTGTEPAESKPKLSLSGISVRADEKKSGGLLQGQEESGLDTRGDEEFGGIFLGMTIEDFNAAGFAFGDSVDVEFSNGYKFTDLPYFNGYYVDAGQNLLIGYPGYGDIKLAQNYGKDLYIEAGLNEGDTATVSLNEKAKYLDVQTAMDIHYFDEREKYPSDEVFANFRNVTVGNLKENVVYRAASPVDNQHKRAPYVDALAKAAGINYDIDLSDNETKLKNHLAKDDFNSPHFLSLYEEGKVIPLAMSMNYFSDDFLQKVGKGFKAIAENDGPYLIHCVEGKDRTGFFLMVLEAFAGADYQEIVDDYMLTYDNYFEITKEDQPEKYEVLKTRNLDRMIKFMCGDDESIDITSADLKAFASDFLKKTGLTDAELELLSERLLKTA